MRNQDMRDKFECICEYSDGVIKALYGCSTSSLFLFFFRCSPYLES